MTPSTPPGRLPQVDLLKALAAHLIVWHHLAFYGPMADHVAPVWPTVVEALAEHGRLAVTVFLVVGGFLAARSLAPDGRLPASARPLALVAGRWWRLVAPFGVVLVAALLANLLASRWMSHDSVDVPADLASWLAALAAHLLLLHDLVGVPALTAGAWYVAIDFQLHAMLVGLLALGRATGRRWPWHPQVHGPWLVALAGLASLYVFNLDARWDVAAPYFAGAYALGAVVAWWAPHPQRRPWLLLAVLAVAGALAVAWRDRLALAAVVAALLAWVTWREASGAAPRPVRAPSRWRRTLAEATRAESDRSYALFLVHFPVALVVNAAFTGFLPHTPAVQGAGLVVAWTASMVVAHLFHRHVERPLHAAWRRARAPWASTARGDPPRDGSALGA